MKIKVENKKIGLSIEHISHYRCGACSKWWSVGDAPKVKIMFCPFCGLEQKIKTIK
jgi:transposase-like protein